MIPYWIVYRSGSAVHWNEAPGTVWVGLCPSGTGTLAGSTRSPSTAVLRSV